MDWKKRIVVDPNVLVGKPIIKGTRIAVEFVVDLLARGWTAEQILEEYDHLSMPDIQACLAYATDMLKSEKIYLVQSSKATRKTPLRAAKIRNGYVERIRRSG